MREFFEIIEAHKGATFVTMVFILMLISTARGDK